MNRKLLLLAFVLIALLAVNQASAFSFKKGKEGSGDLETRELSLDDFKAIDIGGAFDLEVSFGNRQMVEVTIDDNLWDLLETKVKGQWLKLDWKKSVRPSNGCHVKIVMKELEKVSIHGAGDVEISDFDGHSFEYKLSGAGNLEMDGKVDNLEISISGAGDADTRDLKANHVDVKISGAGNASVYAAKSLRGRVSGVGNLTYYGDPEERDTSVSGMGNIKRK